MKTTIHKFYVMILIIIPFFASSQNTDDLSGTYRFGRPTQLPICDYDGVTAKAQTTTIDFYSGILFEIIDECPEGYVIRVYKMTIEEKVNVNGKEVKQPTQTSNNFNEKYFEKNKTPIYFFLSYDKYKTANVYKLRNLSSFTVGGASSIIKIRPGIKSTFDDPYPAYFDFGNDFSLGILVGWKIYYSRNPNKTFASNILFGFGSTSLSVDSLRTKGLVKSTYNLSAFYFSFGHVFEYRNVQFGAFLGVDYLPGAVGRNWIYRDRPWLGITLGYSIFSTKSPNQVNDQKKIH